MTTRHATHFSRDIRFGTSGAEDTGCVQADAGSLVTGEPNGAMTIDGAGKVVAELTAWNSGSGKNEVVVERLAPDTGSIITSAIADAYGGSLGEDEYATGLVTSGSTIYARADAYNGSTWTDHIIGLATTSGIITGSASFGTSGRVTVTSGDATWAAGLSMDTASGLLVPCNDGNLRRFVTSSTPEDFKVFVQSDANYNVTAILNVEGDVLERFVESPYGGDILGLNGDWSSISGWSVTSDTYGWLNYWQGLQFDSTDQTYYNESRPVSVVLDRALVKDFIGYGDGMNPYQNRRSNPVVGMDPSGMDMIENIWISPEELANGRRDMAQYKCREAAFQKYLQALKMIGLGYTTRYYQDRSWNEALAADGVAVAASKSAMFTIATVGIGTIADLVPMLVYGSELTDAEAALESAVEAGESSSAIYAAGQGLADVQGSYNLLNILSSIAGAAALGAYGASQAIANRSFLEGTETALSTAAGMTLVMSEGGEALLLVAEGIAQGASSIFDSQTRGGEGLTTEQAFVLANWRNSLTANALKQFVLDVLNCKCAGQ